ncbi:MAG: hypothetical protein HYX21_02340 [Candidatus Yanofskybacteria bacterium]|nr:hypothetical protein [Candidatus Yanofskybacteria bacterium]
MNRVTNEKIYSEISTIKREMGIMRSLVIGMLGRDEEGEYNPVFVRKILRAAKEKPTHTFNGCGSLLEAIKKVK